MSKEYKPIPGYEGLYEIAMDGSVRSLDRFGVDGRRLKGKDKTLHEKPNGYPTVKLTKDGKTISHNIKYLIDKTFK
ncbi:NUMOD4 domain-containing protein [Bacillus inaquosorum]|uniref:NUMOD4 domain-containing protein n=1 Tax=Bacillus inaquosorum TaxID=483913 RepID=UPI0039903503